MHVQNLRTLKSRKTIVGESYIKNKLECQTGERRNSERITKKETAAVTENIARWPNKYGKEDNAGDDYE